MLKCLPSIIFVTLSSLKASESACAWYNGDYQNFPDYYIDFLKQYFIAQIDAFEYGEMVRTEWGEGGLPLNFCLPLSIIFLIKNVANDDNYMMQFKMLFLQLRPLSVN